MHNSNLFLTEKYLKFVHYLTNALKFIGINLFDENYRHGIRTLATFMVLLTINLGTIYTVYISIPDYIAVIKTLLLSGLGVQVVN